VQYAQSHFDDNKFLKIQRLVCFAHLQKLTLNLDNAFVMLQYEAEDLVKLDFACSMFAERSCDSVKSPYTVGHNYSLEGHTISYLKRILWFIALQLHENLFRMDEYLTTFMHLQFMMVSV